MGIPLSREAERVALAGVLIVAVAFRFLLLAEVPPAIFNDESMFSYEASWRPDHADLYGLSLLTSWPRGWAPYIFGFGWNGFPTLSFFAHWLPMKALGVSNWSLRFGSAVIGTLSIVPLYLWARRWWGNAVAICAALALSINIEHVYWSRLALNNIDTGLVSAWALAALAWALDTRSPRAWISLGYALGFGFYTYHGAKLHIVLAALALVSLAIGRIERFSRADLYGVLIAALAAALVVAPLAPDIAARWRPWYESLVGRVDIYALFEALLRGDAAAARAYIDWHFHETARLLRPAPVMTGLFLCGSAIAVWRWKDPRYTVALLWTSGILVIGSATIGWRGARLVGAMPALSLMAALAVGHTRDMLARHAPPFFRRVAAVCGFIVLGMVLYESWWVTFVWRAQFRNATFGLCRAVLRLPLPATIYVAGKGKGFSPEEALHVCTIPDDPRRHFTRIRAAAHTAPDLGEDANAMAIIFPERLDLLAEIRQRYPWTFAEPFLLTSQDPFVGWVPGSPAKPPENLAFYVIRLRSSCPAVPLWQTYNPCSLVER